MLKPLELTPHETAALWAEARALFTSGAYSEAYAVYRGLVALGFTPGRLVAEAALTAHRCDDVDTSEALIRTLEAADPKAARFTTQLLRAELAPQQSRIDVAVRHFGGRS